MQNFVTGSNKTIISWFFISFFLVSSSSPPSAFWPLLINLSSSSDFSLSSSFLESFSPPSLRTELWTDLSSWKKIFLFPSWPPPSLALLPPETLPPAFDAPLPESDDLLAFYHRSSSRLRASCF